MQRVATRDIFLCQIVALIAFLFAQKVAYFNSRPLGYSIIFIPLVLLVPVVVISAKWRALALPYAVAFVIAFLVLISVV